jgi:hypothetical protein
VLWAYIQNTLRAYRLNGEPALGIPLTPHGDHGYSQDVALSVNADNGTVWLGVKRFGGLVGGDEGGAAPLRPQWDAGT